MVCSNMHEKSIIEFIAIYMIFGYYMVIILGIADSHENQTHYQQN